MSKFNLHLSLYSNYRTIVLPCNLLYGIFLDMRILTVQDISYPKHKPLQLR